MGTAIAIRNQSFMDAFQKFVAEKQEEINKVNRLQGLYVAVQDAMEICVDIKNDSFKLTMGSNSVNLSFVANDDTTREDYWKIYRAVYDSLVHRRLIDRNGGTYPGWGDIAITASFSSFGKSRDWETRSWVYLTMNIPETGTRHIKVNKSYKAYTSQYAEYAVVYDDNLINPPWNDVEAT